MADPTKTWKWVCTTHEGIYNGELIGDIEESAMQEVENEEKK